VRNKRSLSSFLILLLLLSFLSISTPVVIQAQDAVDAPTLRSPADASMVNQLRPTLRWARVRGADLYRVDLADNAAFTNPILSDYERTGASMPLNTRYLAEELHQGTFYWRVSARSRSTGEWSTESAVFSLTVHVQRSPRDESYTTSTHPSFRWVRSRDALRYRLLVDDDPNFGSPEIDYTTDDHRPTSYRMPRGEELAHNLYYWRVDVEYAGGWEVSPVVFQFTVHAQRSPRDESVSRSTRPRFSWTRSRDALRYRLLVDDDSNFGSPEIDLTTDNNRQSSYAPPRDAELPYAIYYWRVDYEMEGGWQVNPVIFQVTVTPRQLGRVRLLDPSNSTWSNDSTPTLTWEAVTDDTGHTVSYEVQVSDQANFRTVLAETTTTNTTFTVPSEIPTDGNVYWRVRAVNWLGVPGRWSARWRIRLDRVAPDAPALVSPDDDSANYDGLFDYRWRSVREAASYEIQIGTGDIVNTSRRTRYTPEEALTAGEYEWHVRAVDRAGNASAWSASWSVSVLEAPIGDEQEILFMVNAERCDRGLVPLSIHPSLTAAAVRHSQDMVNNNFFDHQGSDDSWPADRATDAGYPWNYVGENIAAGYTTTEAVFAGWMNSTGHRENILRPAFREMGLARIYGGQTTYGNYWTQVFGNRSGAPAPTCGSLGLANARSMGIAPLLDETLGVLGTPFHSE